MRVPDGCHDETVEVPRVGVQCRTLVSIAKPRSATGRAGGLPPTASEDSLAAWEHQSGRYLLTVNSCSFADYWEVRRRSAVMPRRWRRTAIQESPAPPQRATADRLVSASGDAQATGGCGQMRCGAFCKLRGVISSGGCRGGRCLRVFLLVQYLGLRW